MPTRTCFELTTEGGHLGVLDLEVLVELEEDEDLRPPVLDVRRAFLQPQQREASGGHRQTADAVTPLLLSPADNGKAKHSTLGLN